MRKFATISVFLFCLSMTGSCGYKFSGGGLLPGSVEKVSVNTFENRTSENGVENIFSNAFSLELSEKSDSEVVSLEDSDAYFVGIVKSISITTLTRSSVDTVNERRVSAVIDLQLIDKEGNILWFIKDFQDHEEYQVTTENLTDMTSRTTGLRKIAERIAQKLVSRMLDDF